MNIIGDQGALQQAMDRRKVQGGSPMSQQSPASAGFDPSTQPSQITGSMPAPQMPQNVPQAPQMPGVPVSPTQNLPSDFSLIIKTLSKTLESLTPKA